ncbi:hypothetical protein FJZ17_01775 [Candidatus Pacearchaeota archaeon]|nr:hypothetical protein [Candidatus Pacearchaeota archaeon]
MLQRLKNLLRKKDKYLIVKGLAGLGNRLEVVIQAILYSKLSGRKLLIDWGDGVYASDDRNAFYEVFECPLAIKTIPKRDELTVFPTFWKGNLDKSVRQLECGWINPAKIKKEYSFDLKKLDYNEDILVMTDYHFHYDQFIDNLSKGISFKDKDDKLLLIRRLLKKYLFLKPQLYSGVVEFKRNNFSKPMIGIHIRYTDNSLEIGRNYPDLEKYNRVVKNLLGGKPGLFLATDNKKILENYKSGYSSLTYFEKSFSKQEEQSIHYSRELDKNKVLIEAVMDLFLLASCDYLIYSGDSSFSIIALALSDINRPNYFDVRYVML